ncbi:MAG: ImmA/IrrE family metallo-endopeptidase [Bacteroidetes bacterium]|nr:ImmA/IrrE family metallo-endopeptidase [Bacteroidota bacterium]
MKIEHNIARLQYLLASYKLTMDDLLAMLNENHKKLVTREDIIGTEINVNLLKRIDKIFEKGLHYYLDPKSPEISQDASIFFRKSNFDIDLNIGAKKIVHQFEEFKISLSAIAKLAELKFDRKVPIYKIEQNAKSVATEIRSNFYPEFHDALRDFLKAFIGKLAENNVLVFEFVETWNKRDKANLDGFFLNPNVIVLKRNQTAFRREIFTLAHELGHYLLNIEEVDQIDIQNLTNDKISTIEKWCNEFAYYFLIGEYDNIIRNLDIAESSNDYHHDLVESISKNTHISQIAIYTRLLLEKKISPSNYNAIRADFDEKYRLKIEEDKKQKEQEKLDGFKQGGSVPKAINSPLLISTIQAAFYEGIINEADVCKTLHIKPEKLDDYLL